MSNNNREKEALGAEFAEEGQIYRGGGKRGKGLREFKQVPRGYIRCDYFIVKDASSLIVSLIMMSFDDFLPSKTAIFIVQK